MTLRAPDEALRALLSEIEPVAAERICVGEARGRVLAEDIVTDRPSPPCDVSAMDGFAVRVADLTHSSLPIQGEIRIGCEAPALRPGHALRIVTGAHVPPSADAVLRYEDITILADAIEISDALREKVAAGHDIRRRGENGPQGAQVLRSGVLLQPARMAALAAFGPSEVKVRQRLKLAVLVTGDELVEPGSPASSWQIRDSNGPQLTAFFDRSWIALHVLPRVGDDAEQTVQAIRQALRNADALVLTGGVSMGTRDFVPDALRAAGVNVIFHRLAQRPGKPLLGGIAPGGKPVLALPGNPVSVLVTARRIALAALAKRAGIEPWNAPPRVMLSAPCEGVGLAWYRLVRRNLEGDLELVSGRGSGDILALAASDGFVEIPPHSSGNGPFSFFAWSD